MCEEQDELMKRFLEKLKIPRLEKSEQTTSSQLPCKASYTRFIDRKKPPEAGEKDG